MPIGDFAAENEFGGAREGWGIDADFEDVATGGADADGRGGDEPKTGGDECRSCDARSAGEGFGFDAAFEGADGDFAGAGDLGEIGIGAAGREERVAADEGAESPHVDGGDVVDEADGMGDAGVEVVEGPDAIVP